MLAHKIFVFRQFYEYFWMNEKDEGSFNKKSYKQTKVNFFCNT